MNRITLFIILIFLFSSSEGQKAAKITILETTDVHGMVMPYDYIEKRSADASLAGVVSYIRHSGLEKDAMVLLDDGDNLQGQPTEYYYNFIDTLSGHINSSIMNYLRYDACTMGNHDIEAGHNVYDRVRKEYKFPLLAANAVDKKSGKPYFESYAIIKKRGFKIAVLGLVTPSIPDWLPPELYSGVEFHDMVETARKWMPAILAEKPDLVVGLFHSGWDKNFDPVKNNYHPENGSAAVACFVPGFDVIFAGHDHNSSIDKVVNSSGDTVLIIDGGSRAEKIGRADIMFTGKKKNGKYRILKTGSLVNTGEHKPDNDYLNFTAGYDRIIRNYVDKVIGLSTESISSRDSYFGPSAFMDMIHRIQLEITGADISFAAPLSYDVRIPKGNITVGDMFKLYRFENMLYTMSLTGREIEKYLEFSYSGWLNTMKNSEDHLIAFRTENNGEPLMSGNRARLKTQPYNFDSAAGIDYIVDVSKPAGQRIKILKFTDGRPFDPDKRYKVAVNSYRGNGGGGHFYEGAGISREELRSRFISSTRRDLRYFIMRKIEIEGVVKPAPLNNWKIIPEDWVKEVKRKDYILMFGPEGYNNRE